MITSEEKQKIITLLNSKLGYSKTKCPMCENRQFIVADGYFNTYMQDDFINVSIGGASIPSIPIVCNKCGFISMHSLGVLGLLPKQDKDEQRTE